MDDVVNRFARELADAIAAAVATTSCSMIRIWRRVRSGSHFILRSSRLDAARSHIQYTTFAFLRKPRLQRSSYYQIFRRTKVRQIAGNDPFDLLICGQSRAHALFTQQFFKICDRAL